MVHSTAVPSEVGSPPSPAAERLVRRLALPLGLVLALQAVLVGRYIAESWFFSDDFLFLREAKDTDLSVEFLRRALFEHFSPVHRVVSWLFVRAWGLSWPAAATLLIGLALACTVAFVYAASAFTRSVRLLVAMAAVYGISLVFVRNAVWWTGGMHLMLVTIFSLLTIGGYVRWHASRRGVLLATSSVTLALALLTHEHALLVVPQLLLLRVVVLEPHPRSVRDAARHIWDERLAWLLYGGLTLAAFVNFVTGYYLESDRPPLGDLARYLWAASAEGLFATLALVKVPEAAIVSPWFTGAVALVLVAALAAATMVRSPSAWRAWVFFVLAYFLVVLPLGLNRVEMFGATIGREPRYMMAPAYLFLLALTAALARPARTRAGERSRPAGLAAGVGWVVAGVAVLLYGVLFVRSAERISDAAWESDGARAYMSRLRADVATRRGAGEEPELFGGLVPDNVVQAWLFPYNRYELAVDLALPGIGIDTEGAGFLVAGDGRLVEATFADRQVVPPTSIEGVETWERRGESWCAPRGDHLLSAALAAPVTGQDLAIRLDLESQQPVQASITVDGGDGTAMTRSFPVRAGAARTYVDVENGAVSSIQLWLPGFEGCLTDITIGDVVPAT